MAVKHWIGRIEPNKFHPMRLMFPLKPQGLGLKLAPTGFFSGPDSHLVIADSVQLVDVLGRLIGTAKKLRDVLVGEIDASQGEHAEKAATLIRDGVIGSFHWLPDVQVVEKLDADSWRTLWQNRGHKPRLPELRALEMKSGADIITGTVKALALTTDAEGMGDRFQVSFSTMMTDPVEADREAVANFKAYRLRESRRILGSVLAQADGDSDL